MRELSDKRVLVTGAGHGIGRALAERFAADGAVVVVTDVRGELADATAAAIEGRGDRAHASRLDVTDDESIAACRRRVATEVGPLDVLVNNAGVVFGGAFLRVPMSHHERTHAVNILGVIAVTHAFLPELIERPEAHLVNVASASGFIGLPFGSTYASSKWAVIGFSESIRLELRELGHSHVGVTTVCPSYAATGMFKGAAAPRTTRFMEPERLAQLVVHAVVRGRPFVKAPWIVKITPLLRALLPTPTFDLVAKAFGVTTSMASWRGHGGE